jgi:hypothetical protein
VPLADGAAGVTGNERSVEMDERITNEGSIKPISDQMEDLNKDVRNLVKAVYGITLSLLAITILLLVLVFKPAHADTWSRTDKALEVTWQLIHAADWLTSRGMSDRYDEGFEEVGPARYVIGAHPEKYKFDLWYVGFAYLHYKATDLLYGHEVNLLGLRFIPRRAFQYVTIGTSSYAVGNSIQIGLKFDLP